MLRFDNEIHELVKLNVKIDSTKYARASEEYKMDKIDGSYILCGIKNYRNGGEIS